MGSDTDLTEPLNKHEERPQAYFVYIVQCSNGAYYTGFTSDVEKRLALHNAGRGAKYTRSHQPVVLVASWSYANKREALRAERQIKRLSHAQKKRLIERADQDSAPDHEKPLLEKE